MQEKERWIVLMRPDDPLAQKGLGYSLVIEYLYLFGIRKR